MMKNEDVAARLELLMNSLERVADELEELGYLDSSKKLDELISELDVEMCWLAYSNPSFDSGIKWCYHMVIVRGTYMITIHGLTPIRSLS